MADTGKQADEAYNKLAQGGVDPNAHLADRQASAAQDLLCLEFRGCDALPPKLQG